MFQACRIGKHPDWFLGQRHCQFVSPLLNQRTDGFHRALCNAAHIDAFETELDPTRRDAGHFEQVVHQMLKLPDLPFNNAACLLLDSALPGFLQPQKLDRVRDGRQRAA